MKMVYLSVTFNQEIHFWFCSFVVRYAVVLALKEFLKVFIISREYTDGKCSV